MSPPAPISILSLSQNRAVVRAIQKHIKPHCYNISGILESDPLSENELALALRVLEPRPAAVVVGRGYSEEEETAETREAFSEYLKKAGVEQGTVQDHVSDVGQETRPAYG
ncbi:hypothetical protein B0I37DRAFT_424685 [Chaetomium sp. MPI-CAGE-AT-0009]|nr:hypothetical protein B0I37DRAFT_424685 [Chaetomium sp. MPI-CAGE-AT-0009]